MYQATFKWKSVSLFEKHLNKEVFFSFFATFSSAQWKCGWLLWSKRCHKCYMLSEFKRSFNYLNFRNAENNQRLHTGCE